MSKRPQSEERFSLCPKIRGLPDDPFEHLPFLEGLAQAAKSRGEDHFVTHTSDGQAFYWIISVPLAQAFLKKETHYNKSAIDPTSFAAQHTVGMSLVDQQELYPALRSRIFNNAFSPQRVRDAFHRVMTEPLNCLCRDLMISSENSDMDLIAFSLRVVLNFAFGVDVDRLAFFAFLKRVICLMLGLGVTVMIFWCFPIPYFAFGFLLLCVIAWTLISGPCFFGGRVATLSEFNFNDLVHSLHTLVGPVLSFFQVPSDSPAVLQDLKVLDRHALLFFQRARATSPMAHPELRALSLNPWADAKLMLLAGAETTATTLLMACHLLAIHPSLVTWMLEAKNPTPDSPGSTPDEMLVDRAARVIDVTMSLFPTAPFILRRTTQPVQFATSSCSIPADTTVFIFTWCMHRDQVSTASGLFSSPDLFFSDQTSNRKSRFLQSLLFGHGGRTCLGKHLALAEMPVALARLIRSFQFQSSLPSPSLQIPCAIDWSHAVIHAHPSISSHLSFHSRV